MSLITVFNVPFEDYALFNDPEDRSNFFREKKNKTQPFSWNELHRLLIVQNTEKNANGSMYRKIWLWW